MTSNRRDFVKSASAVAALGFLTSRGQAPPFWGRLVPVPTPPGSTPGDPMIRELAMRALDAAKAAGATYADVRIAKSLLRRTIVRDMKVDLVRTVGEHLVGVRVIANGAWGFASTARVTADDVTRVAQQAVAQARMNAGGSTDPVALAPTPAVADGAYTTPIARDAFSVPIGETLDHLLAANEAVTKVTKGAEQFQVFLDVRFKRTVVSFASTDDSWIVQTLYTARGPGGVVAVGVVNKDHSDYAGRASEQYQACSGGYEALEELRLAETLPPLADEAQQVVSAKDVDVGRYDVVLDGYTLAPAIANTIGSATELDRALGYEQENGTSYLRPPAQVVGTFRLGSPKVTIRADGALLGGVSTVGWDAEGVKPDTFPLVDKGIVVDFLTNRELAPRLAAWYSQHNIPVHSHGCAGVEDASLGPMIFWPSFVMEPAATKVTVDELIAPIKKGLYFSKGAWASLDPPLMNGMFGSYGMVYEITNGKLGALVKHAALTARTTDLWKSVEAVGGPTTVVRATIPSGKGNPTEDFLGTVSAPAVRVKQVNVLDTYRKEAET